jgi:nucleotide-binding universal stress UspA family protein
MLAKLHGAGVVIVHVVEEGDEDRSDQILGAARDTMAEVPVETRKLVGVAAQQIVAEAKTGGYDLLVVGAKDRGTLAEQLPGSVVRSVLSHAPIPVLVVRGKSDDVKKILICTGAKSYAEPAVRQGVHLAQVLGASVTLLHVSMSPATMYSGLSGIDENLSELLQTETPEAKHLRWASGMVEEAGVQGELLLRHGAVAEEILREVVVEDYDLVVLGAPLQRGPLTEYLLGDVTKKVLSRAERPVLVVRHEVPTNS